MRTSSGAETPLQSATGMAIAQGTRLGPYEILAPLGAGGMGEVYRATDTRLKRQVAIKILPPDLAADASRLARFQREAEVLASLNHPHIAAIYGVEESMGLDALVMELVEGPTLADRIERGPIPVDEALAIARQIAEALEAAHEQGIVHRDLKPANIKVRDDGAVKVLDFGLAKARDRSGDSSDVQHTVNVANSPTLASPAGAMLSRDGVILGTAAYMSPEQARGRPVDKRTDVWAFGAVLYEMLTGTRAFEGDDITELMASVVKSTPNWAALPADVPAPVVTLIQRCLEKDRKTRIGDIAVARFLLSSDAIATTSIPTVSAVAIAPASRWTTTAALIAAGLVAGGVVGWLLPRGGTEARAITHLQLDVSPAERLTSSANSGARPARIAVALSPDGRRLAFAGTAKTTAQIFLRELDKGEASPLTGTENGQSPFFSPDGAWIAFTADNAIKKIPAAGGPAAAVCDLPAGAFWGASWGDDGNIYFAARAGIFKVAASGGTPSAITRLDLTRSDRQLLPQLLPGGASLVFTAPPNVVVLTLASGEQKTLVEGASDARYVPTGHLLFMKSGTLMAAPFDARAGHITGPAVALIENLMHGVGAGNGGDETQAGQYAVSANGTLVYATGGIFPVRQQTLMWIDRHGATQPLAGAGPRSFLSPRLSPDGQKIAVDVRSDDRQSVDVWVYDAARGSPTRLTFDGGNRSVWSRDSKRLVYTHSTNGIANLYVVNADGSGKPERVTTSEIGQTATSWAAATNTIAFMQRPTPDSFGIFTLPMADPAARKPSLLFESRFAMTHADFSPDGRWIAYQSNESGTPEVYVQAASGSGEKIRISTAMGFEPIWTANGREILFRSGPYTQQFLSATVPSLSPFHADAPRLLFEAKPAEFDSTTPTRAWDASADGQRFIALRAIESTDRAVTALHVVLNWTDELKRRVPAK
jgi:eukaryotic-like serine/threonine-protein kinase